MIKKLISVSSTIALFSLAFPVGAVPALNLPDAASDNAAVRYLGERIDPATHELVEGYAIVHYKNKKGEARGGNARAPKTKCYGFMASGAKWKWVEPWVVNPENSRGLASGFVFGNLAADIAKWEDATDGVLGNGGLDVLGGGSATTDVLVADTASPDNVNEVYFA